MTPRDPYEAWMLERVEREAWALELADTAEPVTPQPVVSRADSDGDDGHTMGHTE